MLGIGIAAGEGVSVGLLVAIFVSNLPEAIGSSTEMRAAGTRPAAIRRLWLLVALICTAATVVGYAIADNVSGNLNAAVDGFAAGALLVMLIDSMIPEAVRKGGDVSGLVTVLGFAVAAALSSSLLTAGAQPVPDQRQARAGLLGQYPENATFTGAPAVTHLDPVAAQNQGFHTLRALIGIPHAGAAGCRDVSARRRERSTQRTTHPVRSRIAHSHPRMTP